MLDLFSIRRESSIEKEEGFSSVRRKEARLAPEIVGILAHHFRGKNMRLVTRRHTMEGMPFALKWNPHVYFYDKVRPHTITMLLKSSAEFYGLNRLCCLRIPV